MTSGEDLPLTARLRAETQPDHDAIEANPRMMRLVAADLTLPDYAAILNRMMGFYAPVERGLRRWASGFPPGLEVEARLGKTTLLHRDLVDVGHAPSRGPCGPFGDFPSIEAAWGCLYVVEGSTLGGQIIARALKRSIGVTSERGAAFHTPYGPLTGARWQGFKAGLTEAAEHGALSAEAVIAGARAAFAALDLWMAADR